MPALVGEAAALTALLGSSLKFEGRFQLQTQTRRAVDMLVVDFDAPDRAARHRALRCRAPAEAVGPGSRRRTSSGRAISP